MPDAPWRIGKRKHRQGTNKVKGRSPAKGVCIEVAGDNCGAIPQATEYKLHLNAAATRRAKHFQVDISDRNQFSGTAIESHQQGMTVAFTFFDSLRMIEATGQQYIF